MHISLDGLYRQNCEFSVIYLQDTWLSKPSDISLLFLNNYNIISQGKICSSHGGLAIYKFFLYKYKNLNLHNHSDMWEGLFVEIYCGTLHRHSIR